jgi:dihydroorotate dehydrogenase electron transfer subunit
MVTCDHSHERLLRRPLGVFQVDHHSIALLYAVVGTGTLWLSQRKKGEQLDILGPLGNGFSISPQSHNLFLVAGGIGAAPLYYLADEAVKKDYHVKLLVGARTASLICPSQFYSSGM